MESNTKKKSRRDNLTALFLSKRVVRIIMIEHTFLSEANAMYDVNQVESLPELLTLSHNFREPIGVLVSRPQPHIVTGIVEAIGEDDVQLDGEWIQLRDIVGVED